MLAHLWLNVTHEAALVAAWLDARDPAAVPRLAWAVLLVIAAAVAGRVGGRLLALVVQVALFAAAVLVAWQMVRLPAPVRPASAANCIALGNCVPGAGSSRAASGTTATGLPQSIQLKAGTGPATPAS